MKSPPLTSTWAPWTKLAASEASQTTVEATSSAVPDPPERRRGDDRAPRASGGQVGDHRRLDHAGVDAVHGDPVRARVARDRLRQRDDAALRGGVGRARGEAARLRGERRDRSRSARCPAETIGRSAAWRAQERALAGSPRRSGPTPPGRSGRTASSWKIPAHVTSTSRRPNRAMATSTIRSASRRARDVDGRCRCARGPARRRAPAAAASPSRSASTTPRPRRRAPASRRGRSRGRRP